MLFPSVVFFLSLLGIAGLFAYKTLEERHKKLVLPPELREKADEKAIQFKTLILEKRRDAAKLPGMLSHLAHIAVHELALQAAHLARFLEAQAHRLADFVSHKHHFKKGETRSEFLKQVREHKNGSVSSNGSSQNGIERL
jgi:hypothetical protein